MTHMNSPGWLSGIFAALMLTVAAYCAGRLVTARLWRRPTELDTDSAHIIMGVAMAGMLVSGLRTLPADLWAGVFGAGAAWFAGQALRGQALRGQALRGQALRGRARRGAVTSPWRCLHATPHLVECAAMVYMFLLPGPFGSPVGSRFSFLSLLLALFLLGHVVVQGDRLTAPVPAPASVPAAAPVPASAPAAAGGCAPAGFGRPRLAPRCAVLCKIAMGITMGYMLVLML